MTPAVASESPAALAHGYQVGTALARAVGGVLAGRHEQIEVAVACVLAGGHLLMEDVPGVGKTLLAQSLAAASGGAFRRVQGTADLLPGDVTGTLAPDGDGFGLRFRPGPVFAHVVLFDELNRANARTQSALLEVMEEGTVTVDGVAHRVPEPFFVVATQNPVQMAGTYPLAEGVTDRFMAAVSLGRAGAEEELEVLAGRRGRTRLDSLAAVVDPAAMLAARSAVRTVHLDDTVARYAVDVLRATRSHPRVRLGASTRAGVATVAMARAFATLDGRDYVAPHDIARASRATLAHRIVTAAGEAAAEVVDECLAGVPAPRR